MSPAPRRRGITVKAVRSEEPIDIDAWADQYVQAVAEVSGLAGRLPAATGDARAIAPPSSSAAAPSTEAPMPTRKRPGDLAQQPLASRRRSVELSKPMNDAITAFGDDPTPENRKALERRIREYARRRKYDGQVLSAHGTHKNKRGKK
jgi:hypothetical protein